MRWLGASLFFCGQAVSAVVVCVIGVLCIPLSSITRARVIALWARFNIWTLKHLCGITCEVQGGENLPRRPAILLANHQSAWETLYFQLLFPPQSYILKSGLLWIPFFGWGLAANRPVAINRARKVKALEQLLRQGRARLQEGRWLVVYPEGTRHPPGQPGKFHAGGALLAAKTGAPVVPVAHNAGLFWPKRGFLKRPGTVHLRIGDTIESEGRSARDINAEAEAWIKATLPDLPQAPQ